LSHSLILSARDRANAAESGMVCSCCTFLTSGDGPSHGVEDRCAAAESLVASRLTRLLPRILGDAARGGIERRRLQAASA